MSPIGDIFRVTLKESFSKFKRSCWENLGILDIYWSRTVHFWGILLEMRYGKYFWDTKRSDSKLFNKKEVQTWITHLAPHWLSTDPHLAAHNISELNWTENSWPVQRISELRPGLQCVNQYRCSPTLACTNDTETVCLYSWRIVEDFEASLRNLDSSNQPGWERLG